MDPQISKLTMLSDECQAKAAAKGLEERWGRIWLKDGGWRLVYSGFNMVEWD